MTGKVDMNGQIEKNICNEQISICSIVPVKHRNHLLKSYKNN